MTEEDEIRVFLGFLVVSAAVTVGCALALGLL